MLNWIPSPQDQEQNKESLLCLPLLFNIVLKALAKPISYKKDKSHPDWKEVKPSLFMVDMILYVLGWPKMSFGFFHKTLWKNLNFLANLIEYPKESVKKKTKKTNKQVQQGCRIQDQVIKVSCMSVHF